MAAHRYWRITGLEAFAGADLELSEFQLLNGATRVDASATLTCSNSPAIGAVANIQDNNLSTSAYWQKASLVGLTLNWDFGGSPTQVNDIRIAGGDSALTFPLYARLEYSDDNVAWIVQYTYGGITWPGPRTLTSSGTFLTNGGVCTCLLHFDGVNGATTTTDSSSIGATVTFNAMAISTTLSIYGGSSLSQTGARGYISLPANTAYVPAGDFCIQGWFRNAAAGGGSTLVLYVKGSISVYSYLVFVNGNGYLQANIFGTGGSVALLAPSLWATNTWCHVAVTRQGNVFRLFVNGLIVSIITAPSSFGALVASAGPLSLANDTAGTYGWGAVPGYIDEFQIINGAAIYTQAFTPPAAPSTATAIDQVQGILQNLGGGRVASGNNLVLPSVIGSSLASYGASSQPPSAFIRGRRDYVYNANGYQGLIDGIVDYKATPFNVPVSRRVRLHRQADGLLIREVFSDPITGEYKFDYIDETQKYFVCSLDHTGAFRAVISDNLTPTIMSGAPIAYPPAHYRSVGPVATYQAGPGTTVVPSTPTGMTVGDLMIASIANMICTVTPPVGWTLVNSYSMNNGANTQQVMLSVYSKYATSADVAIAAHTFSFSATSTQGATGVITAFYNPAGLPVVVDTSAVNGYLVGNASTPPQQSQTMIFTPMRVTNNNSHIMLVTAQAFMGTTFNAGTGLILRAGSTAGGIGVCTGTSNLQSGYENGVGYNGYMMTWNNVATQPAIGIGLILTT